VFVVVTATPFKVSFPLLLLVWYPKLMVAAGVPKVSFPAMIDPLRLRLAAVVQFDGLYINSCVI
jgi:hypothetical protein